MNMLWYLIIGLIAGLLAGLITKARGSEFVGYVVVGISGAVPGGMLAGAIGKPFSGSGEFVLAIAGALLLLVLIEVVKRIA